MCYDWIMNKKKIFKISFLLIFILLLWGIIWSCHVTRVVRKNNSDSNMKNQTAIVKNIIVTETQDEKRYWEFYAKSGEYNSEHNQVKLFDVIGNFYNKDEEVVVSFKSNSGQYDEQSKEVVLEGDILFVGKGNAQLYADKIIWKGKDSDIFAYGNIQFIQDTKLVSKANRAIFNSTLTNFKILDNTKTTIYANDEDKKKYTQL